ncbi:FecR protein [Parapedobacter composti]|uniref:FecR protein n=1 Tax=Parapedobacter composti TaxID=623281 RepID=A0A1I1HSH8_9SPHI|nr:FecR domain-containing protein [Parapedobacter composti]SFC24918.1 FecR protein [Parapedobacter composti]
MTELEKELLKRFLDDNYSAEEYEHIQQLLRKPEAQGVMEEITQKDWKSKSIKHIAPQNLLDRWSKRLLAAVEKQEGHKQIAVLRNRRSLLSYAAVFIGLVLLAGVSIYFFKTDTGVQSQARVGDTLILPGADKALLTLADGSVVSLSNAKVGTIALQGGLEVEKKNDGSIRYRAKQKERPAEIAYNTITTPRGGQYRVTLPDGSNVLLNAASSLTYPVHFSDEERRVTMTGEAYFEITSDALSF